MSQQESPLERVIAAGSFLLCVVAIVGIGVIL